MNIKTFRSNYNSIRKRLTKNFAFLLSCMILLDVIFVLINLKTVNQYKSIVNNISLEGQISAKTEELVNIYDSIVRLPGKSDKKLYNEKWTEIENILSKLDETIVYNKSKKDYYELKNILNNINKDSNSGLSKLGTAHALDAIGLYETLLKDKGFVTSSVGSILVDESEYMQILDQNIRKEYGATLIVIFITLACVSVFSMLFAIRFGRNLTKQINKLNDFAKEISSGNLNISDIKFNSKDEVEDLRNSFINMKDSLKGIVKDVQENSMQILASSSQLSTSMEESSKVNEEIVASAALSSEISRQQCDLVDSALTKIENSNKEMREVLINAKQMQEQSNETINNCMNGKRNLENTMQQLSRINTIILDFNIQAETLNKRNSEITNILNLINNISNQTKMLSLNASIEAARAGEHGRGFAVVAGEIGKLSQQTGEAVKEISSILNFIKNDTEVINTKTKSGILELEQNKQVSSNVINAFSIIESSNKQVNSTINKVNNNINLVVSKMNDLLKDMANLKEHSIKLSCVSASNSASMEEQAATIEEVNASSDILKHMASEMQNLIKKFNV